MELWEALVLGFVQGATEFLPVSSSGHLVIAQALLEIQVPGVAFEVAVHLATLISIVFFYRSRVLELVRGALSGDRDSYRYLGLLVVATIPAGLLGVLARDRIEALFDNPYAPGFALLATGAFLWSSKATAPESGAKSPTWVAAVLIGLAQAFALIPGISRSGATVVAALWLGLEAREAAAFSFMMAIPAIGGAAILQLPELTGGGGLPMTVLLVGGVVAAVTGVLAIRTFVAVLARRSFHFFAPYCWAVGAAYLAFLVLR
ncbi:MAG: undecaprenyl-diphosphate phosphatase [Gemmatimonadetes bacterium]|nr:undecaprenyl-diphosphate phosphatase [Gemmatimonadota bacterium]MDA1103997.1 undecaprenyl-diphosphate phosphatase [Gemmatimonadota bacterium]